MAVQMLEQELETLLDGKCLGEPATYDSAPETLQHVRLRKSVCYIVLAVILNDQKEVLVMQEAKQECYGKWYLPAGRMELNETIVEAMKREVQEETGLECEARTLLAVQEHGPCWIRYVFLAQATGGALKTTEQADAESLQASWWDRAATLSLRARDILPLIELALRYSESPSHPPLLPHEAACAVISQRLLIVFASGNEDLWVLLATQGSPHLPVTACGSSAAECRSSIWTATDRLLKQCLLLPEVKVQTCGVLGLRHLGKASEGTADGVCFNLLICITHAAPAVGTEPPGLHGEGFQWLKVPEVAAKRHLLQRLAANAVVQIHS